MRVPRLSATSIKLFLVLAVATAFISATVSASLASPTACVSPGAAAAAKAMVANARKPVTTFNGPKSPAGPPPKGKKVAIVDIVSAPYPNNLETGEHAATKAVGWTTRSYNAKGTPQGLQQAMASALAAKPDAIILNADPIAFMQPQLKQAKAQGIKVVALTPGLPTTAWNPAKWNVTDVVETDRVKVGTTLGGWVVQDSPTGTSAIALTSPEFADFNGMSQSFQKTIKAGGSCFSIATTVASPVADLGGGPTAISRLAAPMKKYPKAKYMFTLSESWFPLFLQAAQQAGRTDVTALGSDGDVSVPLVKQGKKLVFMGTDPQATGWAAVDALIRAYNGKPQFHYVPALRLIDKVNAPSINTPGITYSYDYPSKWKALWH